MKNALVKTKNIINAHAISLLTVVFFSYVLFTAFFVWRMARNLMEEVALTSVSGLADTLEAVRETYADEVVEKVINHQINVSNDFEGRENTIPLPVNFTIEIGRRMSLGDNDPQIFIYSSFPFQRRRGRVLDDFQKEAMAFIESGKGASFYRFETANGLSVLRYARTDVLQPSCVRCHNSHPESPKRDWKAGDIRGILEVTQSVDAVQQDLQKSLLRFSSIFMLFGVVGAWAVLASLGVSRRSTKVLIDNRLFLKKMMDVSSAVLSVFNFELKKLVFVSPAIIDFLGYSPEEVLGMDSGMENLMHPEDVSLFQAHRDATRRLRFGEFSEVTYRMRRKNGDLIHVMTKSTPFKIDDGGIVTALLSSTVDVSRIQNLQEQLRRSNNELENFAGVAAHDLRSPIAAISSWLDVLDAGIPVPRSIEIDQEIGFIRLNAKKALDLIQDILELSRLNSSSVQVEAVDLNRTVSNVLGVLAKDIAAASAEVHVNLLPVVRGIPSQLECIFANLIRNALTYRSKERTPVISVGYVDFVDHYQFFVRDNGIGIDPKFADRIFGMFTRLHSADQYPGTGIGLAYCKKSVELAGGKIWVTSVPGEGSVFYFTHPHRLVLVNNKIEP